MLLLSETDNIEVKSLEQFIKEIKKRADGCELYNQVLDNYGFENADSVDYCCAENFFNEVSKFCSWFSELSNAVWTDGVRNCFHRLSDASSKFSKKIEEESSFRLKIKNLKEYTIEKLEENKDNLIGKNAKIKRISPFQLYYRGEASVDWSLLPSVFRDSFWNKESYFYHEIQVRCPSEFRNAPFLERLVTMQHFGCPTRLLDITSNPLNALYFACEDAGNKNVKDGRILFFPIVSGTMSYCDSDRALILSCLPHLSVYEQQKILDEINKLNANGKTTYDGSVFFANLDKLLLEIQAEKPSFKPKIRLADIQNPLFVQPNLTNSRIVNQQGAFLLSGLSRDANEAERKLKVRAAKTKLIIKAYNKKKILKELDAIGINKATVYPNMEKVAEYLKSL